MNKNIRKITAVAALLITASAFGQIKEERLVLDRKREPEVKNIDKKKTSVETIKNYPPESKSQDPVNYDITNVPAVSDFRTSTIQGEDISPQLGADYQKNFAQFGMGNYGKILFDANASHLLENKMEVGADAHVIHTNGLKDDYPWESRQNNIEVGAFLNSYGEKGKINANASFNSQDYNFYGIYALQPSADTMLKQQVQNIKINGYSDYYSNHIINDVRVKTSFLKDFYDSKENHAAVDLNLSKHGIVFGNRDLYLNADLGLGIESLKTEFSQLLLHEQDYFEGKAVPKLTLHSGKTYFMVGSGFSYLSYNRFNNNMSQTQSGNKTYWFPRAEVYFAASNLANFYVGVDGGLTHNSYENMLRENPYLAPDQQVLPTHTKYRIYFGIKGDVAQNFKYDLSAGIAKVNDLMYFKANSIYDNSNDLTRRAFDYANTFSAVYGNGNVNQFKGSVQYFPMQNLLLEAELQYNFYRLNNEQEVFNKPAILGSVGAKYSVLDKKLLLGSQLIFSGSKKTNYFTISPDSMVPAFFEITEHEDGKVAGYADLNISAEYRFHKNFSIFALGNNLLGNKYEIQKGYKVLGAQILGGLKIMF